VDLRLPPWEKPRPPNFPEKDPSKILLPLYDSYAGPVRSRTVNDSQLNPILADVEKLPQDMLLIIPAIDILVHEQLTFIERVKEDLKKRGEESNRRVEYKIFEKGFHGWLERKAHQSFVLIEH
jgi:hypothetical protein